MYSFYTGNCLRVSQLNKFVFLYMIELTKHNLYFKVPKIPSIYTISIRSYDINWREKNRLPLNPTSHGPLTNLPDYTFLDGRPTPLGVRRVQETCKVLLCSYFDLFLYFF